jgi:homoserine O-acetyltransferase
MDSHRIHRGYTNTVEERLVQIHQPTLIIGIQSDVLCPPNEQHKMAEAMPSTTFHLIDSEYGHDGFLVEHQQIESIFEQWRNANPPA